MTAVKCGRAGIFADHRDVSGVMTVRNCRIVHSAMVTDYFFAPAFCFAHRAY